ncbi:MAG TPA: alcohol dehydrogenase catalytic domain-containing protein [Firmicutes bacterium]|nr:alcohol dehydrogenase catalytic domain-containing protein [Bacillota bacterium]
MIAAVLHGPGDMRVETVDTPAIGPGDILVRVKAAAVCGTDLRIFKSGFNRPDARGPGPKRILGHEVAGEVEAVGDGVTGFRPGDRVTIAPNIGCGTCNECVQGYNHLCRDYRAIGIALDGGFAEYVLFPAKAVAQGNVCKIPENLSYEEAAINEPLSCCYNGMMACRVSPGDAVLIIGAGPIGALHIMLARLTGARKIMVSDIVDERLKAIEVFGPDAAINPTREALPETIMAETQGRGADVVIVACPSPDAQREALELAAVCGRINFFGGLPRDIENVPLNTNLIHYKQLTVTGTTGSSTHQFRNTLAILASGKVNIRPVITSRVALRDIAKAFSEARDMSSLKTVILP